jgi:hypothetical protein
MGASMTHTRKQVEDALRMAHLEITNGDVLSILDRANKFLNGHGVEDIWQGNDKPSCLYVNMGDTYARTIVHDDQRGFQVTSWGDWLEAREAE